MCVMGLVGVELGYVRTSQDNSLHSVLLDGSQTYHPSRAAISSYGQTQSWREMEEGMEFL